MEILPCVEVLRHFILLYLSRLKIPHPNKVSEEKGLSKFAVIDCLHNDVSCNEIGFAAVTNQHTLVTVFVNHSGCAIGGIQDGFHSCIFKDGLITAGTFKFFQNIMVTFLFGKTFEIIIHDDTLP